MEKVVLPLVIVAYIVFLIYKAKSNKRRYANHTDGESMRAREHNLKRKLGVKFISIGIIILTIAIVYYNENK